jgi:dynamin family protein
VAGAELLAQLRAYATEVSECAAALSTPAEFGPRRGELRTLADQIVAEIDEPLRIGFVGEFSAGKSLMLGVLVGKPDLLPTSMEPTTGNVTELRFRPAADDAGGTGIGGVEVRFFGRADIDELDRCIMSELRDAAHRAQLSAADLALLDGPDAAGTPQFRDWCASMSQRDNIELRKLIRELLLLRDAAQAAPGWLGHAVRISWDQLRAALEIRIPFGQGDLPLAPVPGSVPFTAAPADAQLAGAFPLIDRVVLDITVPEDAWPVSASGQNQGFTLLDFPGIGGANTKARDLFLTRRGLTDVHTILVLVNAGRAGGAIPDDFYRFLRELDVGPRDGDGDGDGPLSARIVYCAGRFDEIPAPKTLVDDLDDADYPFREPERMTVDRLLEASRPLSALLQSGHQPGLSSMRAFASSVLAISRLGLPNAPEELHLADHREVAERRAAQWQKIAEALRADGTGLELAGSLLGYAADGGIAEVRGLLDQHVADNGIALRVQKAQRRLDQLDALKDELADALRVSPQVTTVAASPAQQAHELLTALRMRKLSLANQTAELRDPARILLASRWSVRQDVMRKAADLVMLWPQWGAIFGCVENAVVVPPTEPTKPLILEVALGVVPEADGVSGLPQRLGDFQDVFTAACQQLGGYACDQAVAGVRRWLEDRSSAPPVRELQRRAATMVDAEVRDRLSRSGVQRLRGLARAVDCITRPSDVANGVRIIADQVPKPALPDFPLRAEQPTSWADGASTDESNRHFIRVLRLRSALIDSVTDYALGCLDAVLDPIAAELATLYKSSRTTALPDPGQFVAGVLGREADPADESPDPAAALAALLRPDRDPVFEG